MHRPLIRPLIWPPISPPSRAPNRPPNPAPNRAPNGAPNGAPNRAARPRHSGRRRAERGVTLIELVIAVAILALGAAAAWSSLDAVRRGIGGQAARALAQEVALNHAAELRLAALGGEAAGVAVPERVRMGGIDWRIALTAQATEGDLAETEIRVTAPGQPGARLLIWLPAASGDPSP